MPREIERVGTRARDQLPHGTAVLRLLKRLVDPSAQTVVVEHYDRLMRFGCEYVEAALAGQERRLVVADLGEVKDDLVPDMVEVLESFCARLFGRRSARSRAEKALAAVEAK